jgi:hypothetical protein
MGALFSALMSLINPQQEYKLVIVGLDNAGRGLHSSTSQLNLSRV